MLYIYGIFFDKLGAAEFRGAFFLDNREKRGILVKCR